MQDKINGYTEEKFPWADQLLFLQKLIPILTTNEKNYLYDTLCLELTPTEIAKKRGVHRRTIYQWKQRIKAKAENYRYLFE